MKKFTFILLLIGFASTAFAGGTTVVCKDAQKNTVVDIFDIFSEGGGHSAETSGFTGDMGANNKAQNAGITFLYQGNPDTAKDQIAAFTVTAIGKSKGKQTFVQVLGSNGQVTQNDESATKIVFSGAVAQSLADHSYLNRTDLTCEVNIEKLP